MHVNEFLRNDHPVKIIVAGIEYPSVEHAFQAAKTTNVDQKKKIAAATAREAKSIGRTVVLDLDWDERRVSVMDALVRQKFFSSDDLRDKLIDTGDEPIEMERRGDTFWGIDDDGDGNRLGKIIMSIRAEAQFIYGWQPSDKADDAEEEDNSNKPLVDVISGRLEALIKFLDPDTDLDRWSAWGSIEDMSTDESNKFDALVRRLVKAYRTKEKDDQQKQDDQDYSFQRP